MNEFYATANKNSIFYTESSTEISDGTKRLNSKLYVFYVTEFKKITISC